MAENVELLVTENIFLRINLDPPGLVAHVNKHAFAHVPMRGDASGDRDFAAFCIIVPGLTAGFAGRELVLERVNALGAQRCQLGFALLDQGVQWMLLLFHTLSQANREHQVDGNVQDFKRSAER